ncbi:uncharacterized protein LOC142230939 [Haematobia irritans]|uniref:uncharacterized protein LOC142230939 n=1 Tax=Haematobia irritans TaxID=7368 RepID=UPI003F4F6B8A
MFHQVIICEQDQTAQRFLWRNGDSSRNPDVYVMQVMIFGSVSSPCSAQYVKNLNAKKFEISNPRAYRAIVECHYVDDYVDSFDEEEEAISVTKDVIEIHKQAGFELRAFVSNSSEFIQAIVEKEETIAHPDLTNLGKSNSTTEKILGLFWSPADDKFRFVLTFKRIPNVVLTANMVIRSKIILQKLWRFDIDWSSPIPDEIYREWHIWYQELYNVGNFEINRWYGPGFSISQNGVDMHVFVDASEAAFAAVAYWRICWEGAVRVVFIAGKVKCAPIKPLSIPRLELQAAVLGVRLKEAIVSSHDIQPKHINFWSDSKTVIKWIHSDVRAYKPFVSHRVSEVLYYSEVKQWKWVPGSKNPADDATRPMSFSEQPLNSRWIKGPEFLLLDEDKWPKLSDEHNVKDVNSELRSKFVISIRDSSPLIPYEEKSKYYTLLRVRCWFMRAVNMFKKCAARETKCRQKLPPYLTAQEMHEAEMYWCSMAQQDEFAEEIFILKSGKILPKNSPIFQLSPYLANDGLVRISSRIKNARCVPHTTKEPIILPKNHLITKIIVKQYHEDFRHQNQESICAAVRTKFWVPSLRQMVRSVKRNCMVCKIRNARPQNPLMGQLPVDRLSPYVRPFSYTGVDYLGPFNVTIGRRCEKRWVSLFTCMTVRAVHVEMARDLSTDSFILCLRNFINRRGLPVRIRSDRGTNFVGASKERLILNDGPIVEECSRRGIDWVFNTPANPAAGGAWERMVRCIKNVLAFTLKEKVPQVDTLNSLLIEAENLVNSRPLTHLPIDSFDDEPLTPNHFLMGCPNIVQTPAVGEKGCLRKQWHILQQLKQTFWKRWVLEYLPDLTRRTKWYQPVKPLKIGDVVIICDDNETRGEWRKGIIVDVHMAADGQVRSAAVKTSAGILRRPASKLAVLDIISESP